MKLLAGTHYDPTGAQITKATSSLLAMTALDTSNLRLTFTAPSNGIVMVRSKSPIGLAATTPQVLWGVLDGATVKARQAPLMAFLAAAAGANTFQTTSMIVGGLTPGQSYTWDLAYSVEVVVASSVIHYSGLNDTVSANQWGGISFEVWDTPGLLAWAHYDPGTAAVSTSLGALLAITAIDTTNLRLTFTAPSSGRVMVRIRGVVSGTTTATMNYVWSVLDGATLRGRQRGVGGRNQIGSAAATDQCVTEASFLVTGLTGGTSYTWDAAYGVDTVLTNGVIKMGGPDDTTTDNAWGGFSFDVWNVDSLPAMIGSSS